MNFTEDELEEAYLEILKSLGWECIDGRSLERGDYHEVILEENLREAIYKINKNMPIASKEEAIKKVIHLSSPILSKANEDFHKMLIDGVDVGEYTDEEGNKRSGGKVYLVDYSKEESNEFLAINQFTIVEKTKRRPDIILFVNGIPLVVIELKSLSNDNVGIKEAYTQIERYKLEIPTLFKYNSFIVISDGVNAKAGTISSNEERFMSFRTVDGKVVANTDELMMQVLAEGMLTKSRILDLTKNFVLFLQNKTDKIKILAQYHQYFAVKKALKKTELATSNEGKIGVIWHTQGSGKSLTMAFYAGQLMRVFKNPTIIILTDRNDLDNQLFGTFSKVHNYLGESPKQANDKDELREMLNVNSGGIIFSTIQKFAPRPEEITEAISERNNIYIIVDEAHRSQYGLDAKMDSEGNSKYGYAKHIRDVLPNANYIGFTGTPIDFDDKSTTAVFGNYIDTYDMTRAVEDGSTVKIYYENRFIKLDINYDLLSELDNDFYEIMENQEELAIEKKKKDITKMEAIIGSESRIKTLAHDFITHWETRRNNAFGKCMIVCASRKISVDLYDKIIELRPQWHSLDKTKGKIKVIMTSDISKDPKEWEQHFTTKQEREEYAGRIKDESDELEIAIVRDMWLTGFDVPCMHTMYIDKPMVGHNLMQAIARVNRVYKDKSGGLVVDYIGVGDALKKALKQYTPNDQKTAGVDTEKAVAIMKEHYEIVKEIFHKFDYSNYKNESALDRAKVIIQGMDFIFGVEQNEKGTKKRFIDNVLALAKAHSLCITTKEGQAINYEVSYFKAVKASIIKLETEEVGPKKKLTEREINDRLAIMMSKTIISEDVIDVYSELGVNTPDISILSNEFLSEIDKIKYKNLAVEMLRKLIEGKIKYSSRKNLTVAEKFSTRLQKVMSEYRNKALTSIEIMEELIKMAKDLMESHKKGNSLGLSEDEIAFYDALGKDEKVKQLMGDDILVKIAKELTETIKKNMTIDWYDKESVQAQMRRAIRRLLKKYGYPPEDAEGATELLLKQAKLMSEEMR
ncbi:MAG: type I restriction endonuclease subunit R [Fusobacteriaceae bacterium]